MTFTTDEERGAADRESDDTLIAQVTTDAHTGRHGTPMMNDHKAYKKGLFHPFQNEPWNAATHVMSWSDLGRAIEGTWGPGPHDCLGSIEAIIYEANGVRARALLSVSLSILGPDRALGFMDPDLPKEQMPTDWPWLNLAHVSDVFRKEDWMVVTEALSMMTGAANHVALCAGEI